MMCSAAFTLPFPANARECLRCAFGGVVAVKHILSIHRYGDPLLGIDAAASILSLHQIPSLEVPIFCRFDGKQLCSFCSVLEHAHRNPLFRFFVFFSPRSSLAKHRNRLALGLKKCGSSSDVIKIDTLILKTLLEFRPQSWHLTIPHLAIKHLLPLRSGHVPRSGPGALADSDISAS